VRDKTLANYLQETVLGAYLRDSVRAWTLQSDGSYERVPRSGKGFSAQEYLVSHVAPCGSEHE